MCRPFKTGIIESKTFLKQFVTNNKQREKPVGFSDSIKIHQKVRLAKYELVSPSAVCLKNLQFDINAMFVYIRNENGGKD
jgi:hypothetical protein